jgi:hypothetical protein
MFVIIIMHHHLINHIGGVMVSVLASIAVDSGFKPLSGQTKKEQVTFKSYMINLMPLVEQELFTLPEHPIC